MNEENFDLNLLRVFEALMAERHVTRAAGRLSLTPSAVSNALGRLRVQFGDDLFVRTPLGMEPTALAWTIAEPLGQALTAARLALAASQPFDAATSTDHFVLGFSDHAEYVLAPSLMLALGKLAPNIQLSLRHADRETARQLLDCGEISAAIGMLGEPPSHLTRTFLMRDEFAVIMRQDHPALQHEWGVETFLRYPHLLVSASGSRTGAIDQKLEEIGRKRNLAVVAAHLMTAGPMVAAGDFFCTVGTLIAAPLCRAHDLVCRPLPLDMGPIRLAMMFHNRHATNPAHQWLRRQIATVARSVAREEELAGDGVGAAELRL